MTEDQKPKTKSQYEHSAGGVVYKRTGDGIKILLIKDKNGNWSFPKGLIEKNEDFIETAKREIVEETGISNVTFVDTIDSISYFYRFGGNLIRKKVDYYLFTYRGNGVPKPLAKEGIQEVKWFDPNEALAIIGYVKTNKPVLEKAISMIANND